MPESSFKVEGLQKKAVIKERGGGFGEVVCYSDTKGFSTVHILSLHLDHSAGHETQGQGHTGSRLSALLWLQLVPSKSLDTGSGAFNIL